MTTKRVRDLQKAIKDSGLTLVAPITSSASNHLCCRVRNAHGVERCFHKSLTPSDGGTAKVEAGEFRRFARQTSR